MTFLLYSQKIYVNDVLGKEESTLLDSISVYIFASQGILLSILRLSEPLVWRTFTNNIKQYVCCCLKMEIVQVDNE